MYISFPDRAEMDSMLANCPVPDPRVVVVTDGERILGLGDLGVGGIGIPLGKLALYTLCAGIHPASTLPVILDVGTDNQALLQDPLYLGWHHERVRGEAYDRFVDEFIQGVRRAFPRAVLQWEDFAKGNARRLLDRYRDQLCTFNDDIQGTGAVTLAGILAALAITRSTLPAQRIVVLGAGSAATGICEQLVTAMREEGASREDALCAIWLVDTHGVVHTGRTDLDRAKRQFAQPLERTAGWARTAEGIIDLHEVVRQVHPTILLGTAAHANVFSEPIVREMAAHVERPIIFPLSNPTSRSEALPEDLIAWTDGRVLVATGSPFPDVLYQGRSIQIGQCNNMFIFPGMGLGVLASGAQRVTDSMFIAAARTLAACSPALRDHAASLYPAVEEVREVSRRVALAVGAAAQQAQVAERTSLEELEHRILETMWTPHYRRLRRRAE
jgi:malate dehydrogenase (oxaloacetate-decarboxylating)